MEKEIPFNFQIKGIEILETSIIAPKNKLDSNIVFGFDLEVKQSFNLENELAIVTSSVAVFDNVTKVKLGHLTVSCIYYIEKLQNYIDKEKNISTLPESAIIMLNSISISTLRGVMYGVFRGTFLNGAILPVVNPSKPEGQKQ